MNRTFILLITLTAFASNSLGQELDKLSFKDAVKIALEKNLTLQQQKNQMVAAQAQKTSGLASMGPRVSINGNAGRNNGNSFNQQEGRVVNGVLDFVNGSLNANMTLFNGFNRLNSAKQSQAMLDSQAELVKRSGQDVMQIVTSQYLQCLLDKELLRIAENNLKVQQKQLEQIAEQVKAGSLAKIDKYNQDFQVKSGELNVLRAKNRLANDKAILAQSLQIDDLDFGLVDPDWDVNQVDFEGLNLAELYEQALANRSDLKQTKYLEKASEFDLKATKGGYYPNINAFFSYGSAYNAIEGFENRSFEEQFRRDNTQTTYGVSFSIPIFNGFQNRSLVVQSKVNRDNAQLNTKAAEITVKSDVLQTYQNLRDAVTNYEASKVQSEAAELSYQLETERYNLHASDLVQFTQASQGYVEAQGNLASARFSLLFQELLMRYATGTLRFEDLP